MSSDTYQLKWHSHSSHMNGSVASLLRSDKYTDVVLCTMDGSQIPAHKFILSSCSLYLNNLFDGQRAVMRLGNAMLYVVLPSEISTKALQVLIEYMYKGETTVSNEVLDMVLKAGEALKIRGLWRQAEQNNETNIPVAPASIDNNVENSIMPTLIQKPMMVKKPEGIAENNIPKISVKKDEKLLKSFGPIQQQNVTRPMFIGPPKLVFIKTSEGNSGLRPLAPKPSPQTIIVTPDVTPKPANSEVQETAKTITVSDVSEGVSKAVKKVDKKYAKKIKTKHGSDKQQSPSSDDGKTENTASATKSEFESNPDLITKVMIKDEPFWEDVEEDVNADPEMFHSEMNIKPDLDDAITTEEEEEQIYSPLTCELCAEVFTIPAAWVRHIQGHANSSTQPTRKRKFRSASDDTEETTALLRCDLCQKHFPNPAEWVRHIQSTHTETELAISNNSAPPKRHNRFTEGIQNKTCNHCKKRFPSHASMVIHMRTHTGERPFLCGLCNKGFNVKSNLLRHLRTLHDQIVHPTQLYEPDELPEAADGEASADDTPLAALDT